MSTVSPKKGPLKATPEKKRQKSKPSTSQPITLTIMTSDFAQPSPEKKEPLDALLIAQMQSSSNFEANFN
jgi:hypothetical protein